jgi:hypothetical protein
MSKVNLNGIYIPSEEIVARQIEGELIIVPLTAGFGDLEDELYTFNETGRAVWRLLDGQRDLNAVVALLAEQFNAPLPEIEQDVLGLVSALLERHILLEAPHG